MGGRVYTDGREHITYFVNWEKQRGALNKKPFWEFIPGSRSPRHPPREMDALHGYLVGILRRAGIELPTRIAMIRNQARGEGAGFHFLGKFVVSDEGLHLLKGYAGTRGIPHTRREDDYAWKFSSLPDYRLDLRRIKPFDRTAGLRPSPGRGSVDTRDVKPASAPTRQFKLADRAAGIVITVKTRR